MLKAHRHYFSINFSGKAGEKFGLDIQSWNTVLGVLLCVFDVSCLRLFIFSCNVQPPIIFENAASISPQAIKNSFVGDSNILNQIRDEMKNVQLFVVKISPWIKSNYIIVTGIFIFKKQKCNMSCIYPHGKISSVLTQKLKINK